jgi:hypothetical protein
VGNRKKNLNLKNLKLLPKKKPNNLQEKLEKDLKLWKI